MMGNTLLIHMGRHKTGTTALQTFLSENRENLEKYGWCYPDLKKEIPELQVWPPWQTEKNGANFFIAKEIEHGGRSFLERGELCTHTSEWNKIWEWMSECLKHKNVIISEEAWWYVADEFLEEVKKKYGNIKVVIYIRRQDRAMESWWNQMVKGGRWCEKNFREYLDSDGIKEIQEGLHYLKKINQISDIVGKESCIVRVYEKEQLKAGGGVISDFLSVLGLDWEWSEWNRISKPNHRLSGNYIEIKRAFNSIRPAGYFPSAEQTYVFQELSQRFCKEEKGYFTTEERLKFMEQFKYENEWIAKEHLHRKDGVLFYDDKMDFPEEDIHLCSAFEENLIQVFSAMLCVQNEEMMRLKRHNDILTWKLLLQKMNGRKLLLFGAGQKCKELLEHMDIPVKWIVDNDMMKKGMMRGRIEVIHTSQISRWERFFVVITCVKTDEVEEQLQGYGLQKEKDYVTAKEYFGWT